MIHARSPRTYINGLLLIFAATLSSCAPAPTATATSATTAVSPSLATTSMPPAATIGPPTPKSTSVASTPTPTVSCPCFDGLSTGLDNSKQARIRLSNAAYGAPKVDVYVNGMPAENGGVIQQNLSDGQFSGWLYVTPGTYTVALVPHGGSLQEALFAPATVHAEAGKRYTVVAMGQIADKDIHPLIVDEKALETQAGAKPSDNVWVEINNIRGIPSIDETFSGEPGIPNIPYGGVKAGICSHPYINDETIVSGNPSRILFQADTQCEAGVSSFISSYNDHPGHVAAGAAEGSQGTSDLNLLDFLDGFTSHLVTIDGHAYQFKTLLSAIDKAGLRDQLVKGGPFMLMAPTDQAFAALPPDQIKALLDDPKALANLLKAHLVDGYFPYGSLSSTNYGTADRTVMNELGQPLALRGDSLNGQPARSNYTVGNGDRVYVIYNLLPTK